MLGLLVQFDQVESSLCWLDAFEIFFEVTTTKKGAEFELDNRNKHTRPLDPVLGNNRKKIELLQRDIAIQTNIS